MARLWHTNHILQPNTLFMWEPETFGTLPPVVGRFDHRVVWEVTYVPMRPPAHKPTHTYRVYTVLNTPNSVGVPIGNDPRVLHSNNYRLWESAYDISCQAAQGATTDAEVLAGLVNHFATLQVPRKDVDGFNNSDDTKLVYWGDVTNIPYATTCMFVRDLLASNDGIGRCTSLSQLFRLCLGIQGVDSLTHVFTTSLVARQLDPANPPNGTLIPVGGAQLQVDFLVRDYIFLPFYGDISELYHLTTGILSRTAPPRYTTDEDPDRVDPLTGMGRPYYLFDVNPPHDLPWSEAVDLPGMPAIGGPAASNPRSWFNSHTLVKVGGNFYDPSYGDLVQYPNAATYAAANIVGVAAPDLFPISVTPGFAQCMFETWSGTPDAPQFALTPSSL
jgi:hypothetical protein